MIVHIVPFTHNGGWKGVDIMTKFAYKVFTYNNSAIMNNDETLENDLQEFGEQGWELVSALPIVKGDGSDGDIDIKTRDIKFIFKKEK